MTSGREEFRYTGCIEAGLSETEGGSQTRTAGTDDDGIVFVILWRKASINIHPAGASAVKVMMMERRTMTGYLLLRCAEASFALRGWLAKTRAINTCG